MRIIFKLLIIASMAGSLGACSTNPATGERQFAALMSPGQEASIGAQEHQKIIQQFGGLVEDSRLQNYVNGVGERVARDTERSDVQYQFFLLDSPVVNAFALPGGYVYVTRGLMAVANTEAQLAGVLAHEIGHVTARHSAERYSHGVAASLGAALLSAALGSNTAAQAANIGSQLYLSSYSRGQENQADELGIRYLHRAGYDTDAMAQFLESLGRYSAFENQEAGRQDNSASYFSTHPQTQDRVNLARAIASGYEANTRETGEQTYLKMIDGLTFGDSPAQGFVRGQNFYHPEMGFAFTVPSGFTLANTSEQVIAKDAKSGTVILFDAVPNAQGVDAATYLQRVWLTGSQAPAVESITIGGKPAATASMNATIDGRPVQLRLVAVQWNANTFFRFQMAIPSTANAALIEELKRTTYSLRAMTPQERRDIRPYRLKLVTAKAGDSVTSLSQSQPYPSLKEQRFRAINGLAATENITPGKIYKLIVE